MALPDVRKKKRQAQKASKAAKIAHRNKNTDETFKQTQKLFDLQDDIKAGVESTRPFTKNARKTSSKKLKRSLGRK